MPIYEFECARCKQIFEQFLFSRNDAEDVKCPRCGGEGVKKPSSFSTCGSAAGREGALSGHSFCGSGGFTSRFR